MAPPSVARLVFDLLLILAAGLVSGSLCKRFGVSMLLGYLVVGALIGDGGLGLVSQQDGTTWEQPAETAAGADEASQEYHGLEYLARAGALLLLFSIGIELSLDELVRLSRYFLIGGSVQMLLVAVPAVFACMAFGVPWQAAVLIGSAAALSSTVLVFKGLDEWGQADTAHGRRAVGILLFQDVAIVPLMLLVPMLTGNGPGLDAAAWFLLTLKSALFVAAVVAIRAMIAGWGVPMLAALRSVELVVLFALTVLGGVGLAAYAIGLPPALGALAAGLILGGNRLSSQVDALILPFRETFAAVFFVGLGTLMRFDVLVEKPLLAIGGLAAVLALKTGAAAVALRLVGLRWWAALGMGLGLAQLGELSFVLLSEGLGHDVISAATYNHLLFIALGTLILTPQLLRSGMRWAEAQAGGLPETTPAAGASAGPVQRAVVIGLGPIGGRVTSQLEINGIDVCLVDLSPVNLHPFAQQGFRTVAGDGRDPETLGRADVRHCRLAVVTVPEDGIAGQVVAAIRGLNPECRILVRCRYQSNTASIRRAGADAVVSEETEATNALVRLLEQIEGHGTIGT